MMRRMWMHRLGQRLAVMMLAGAAVLVTTGAGGARAAGGYGPPAPVPPAVPRGHCAVVTSQTITAAGGTIGPAGINGALVTLTVPAGAFPVPAQVTLTAPDQCGAGAAAVRCFTVVAGVGIQVQENGSAYPGPFPKPLSLAISSPSITASSILAVRNGTALVTDPDMTARPGELTASFGTGSDFAVLTPACRATTAIPGATSAVTGKPLLGEAILAAVLLLLGASGLGFARRRRAGH